jgi:hypothetical protein
MKTNKGPNTDEWKSHYRGQEKSFMKHMHIDIQSPELSNAVQVYR